MSSWETENDLRIIIDSLKSHKSTMILTIF